MQKNSKRGVALSRLIIAGTLLASSAHAQDILRIQRGASGTVEQEIAITSANYSSKARQLIVSSANGGRVCGGAQSKAEGTAGVLVLDGRRYALDEHNFGASRKVLTVTPRSSNALFPLCINQAAPKGSQPLRFNVNVAANADAATPGRSTVSLANSEADYTLTNGRLTLPLSQDVLCLNVGSGTGEPTLNLVDTNNAATQFVGLSDLEFRPASSEFRAETSDDLVCVGLSTPAARALSKFDEACQLLPVPAPIFHSGFGDDRVSPPPQLAPGVDLQVDVELDQNPTLPATVGGTNEPGVYRVQVRNCGTLTATSVSVRDFWRPQNAGTEPRYTQASTWQCSGCTGGFTSGSGYIEARQQTLPSLATLEFVATRALDNSATVLENEVIETTVAAFAGPAAAPEYSSNNNAASFPVPVRLTNNTPPTVSINFQPDPIIERTGNPPALIELFGVATANDVDDGTFGEIASVNVSYDQPSMFSAAGALIKNGSEITVTLRPVSGASGTSTISVVAVDGAGDPSTPATFDFTINPINNPPTFEVYQFDSTLPGFLDTAQPTCVPVGSPGDACADQVWLAGAIPNGGSIEIPGWIASESTGAANESGQTLTYETVSVSDPSGIFINSGFFPEVDANGELEYGLDDSSSGDLVTGTAIIQILVRDDGGTEAGGDDTSEILEFRVIIQ